MEFTREMLDCLQRLRRRLRDEQGVEIRLSQPDAVPRMLAREGLGFADFDFFEIHEAFAARALCTLKAWEDPDYCRDQLGLEHPLGPIDRAKLNVNGGSLACGHPFAATGGRQLASLGRAIHERGGGRGLISICAAGGLGVTAIVEK